MNRKQMKQIMQMQTNEAHYVNENKWTHYAIANKSSTLSNRK